MCLIRVKEVDDDDHIAPRRVPIARTTTVVTPIPPAPPPPPPEPTYTALVPTNVAYDVGTNSLVEGYAERDYRDQRVYHADSEYMYADGSVGGHRLSRRYSSSTTSSTDSSIRNRERTATKIISVSRSGSRVGRSTSIVRSHSRSASASHIDTKNTNIVLAGGVPYVKAHRHRHRRRSGSLERERTTTHFTPMEGGRHSNISVTAGGRHSTISISNGHGGRMLESDINRSSFRYIEPRSSAARGIESAEMVRRREAERFAYGGVSEHRRSGSVSYVNAGSPHSDSGHRRSFSGGPRLSREKVILMDSKDYYH